MTTYMMSELWLLPVMMRRALFGDTSFIYVLADADDHDHTLAVAILDEVIRQRRPIVVTTCIIADTHALVLRHLGYLASAQWLRNAFDGFFIIRPTEADEQKACDIIFTYTDKDFSFTDAISFAVMERLNITVALSLDEPFVQFSKFTVVPLQISTLPAM